MSSRKRITAIFGFGVCFIVLELFFFRDLARIASAAPVVSAAGQLGQPSQSRHKFHWNWRDWQELSADQSLRNAKLPKQDKQNIEAAIASQLRPNMSDLEIESEERLHKAALDTRVKMIDLNDDGIPEVLAQGMVECSPTGNCVFWIFKKSRTGYRLLLEGEAQTFTIQRTSTNGFRDIVLGRHASATESELTDYRYKEGIYEDVGCYDASWEILENDKVRELKDPRITRCGYS